VRTRCQNDECSGNDGGEKIRHREKESRVPVPVRACPISKGGCRMWQVCVWCVVTLIAQKKC
jgi:hypothetical protein